MSYEIIAYLFFRNLDEFLCRQLLSKFMLEIAIFQSVEITANNAVLLALRLYTKH